MKRGTYMAVTKAKLRANKKWNDENINKRYDRLNILVPKGEREQIKSYAQSKGMSVNAFVNMAIERAMQDGDVLEFSDNDPEDIQ